MGNYRENKFGGGGRQGGGSFGSKRPWDRDGGDRGERQMHRATCEDCGNSCEVPFRPTGEKPVYCRECYSQHGGGATGRPGRVDTRVSFGDRPKFQATCVKCHNSCEVPFRPSGDKPVYCRECFAQQGGGAKGGDNGQSKAQLDAISAKLDLILKSMGLAVEVKPAVKPAKPAAAEMDLGDEEEVPAAKPAKAEKKAKPAKAAKAKPAKKAAKKK